MDSWKSLIITLAFTALFSFAFIGFIYSFQVSNNQNVTILSNGSPLSSFNASLSANFNNLTSTSRTAQGNLENETYQAPPGAISSTTIFTSIITFPRFIYGFVQSINPLFAFIGIPTIIFSVIIAILSVVVILLWWKMYKIAQ